VAGVARLVGARVTARDELPPLPGSYALIFRNSDTRTVRVGALGKVSIEAGFLVYVGSAFGPGGLRARVSRHARMAKKRHWHIDYLRPHLSLEEVWWTTAPDNREHDWAERLGRCMATAHPRFGASDCACRAHLLYSPDRPDHAAVGDVTIWHP